MTIRAAQIEKFRKEVLDFYKEQGRHHLPWRKTKDAYKILVSEIMLQQTQVDRVRPFYERFLERFPTVAVLADAPLGEVLRAWQGLGYNRRAKMLHEAAKKVVAEYGGKLPKSAEKLEQLPGIGPYTARAVAAFAGNADDVFVETNIRTAVFKHFFPKQEVVTDKEVLGVLERALPQGNAREWYWALMDYGSHLKRSGARLNAKSAVYMKQPKFSGSAREARGAVLKALTKGPQKKQYLLGILGDSRKGQVEQQLEKLEKEQMLERKRGSYQLPS